MKLPEEELRRAVLTAAGGSKTAETEARARMAVATIGTDLLAEQHAVRDVLRAMEPYPLGDEFAIEDWRCLAAERLAVAAAGQESDKVKVTKELLARVEATARRRAEAVEQERRSALAGEQARLEAEREERRAWQAVAIELGIVNIYGAADPARARARFDGDMADAEDEVAHVRAVREATRLTAERQGQRWAITLGGAGAVFMAAGFAFAHTVERRVEPSSAEDRPRYREEKVFNWGAALGSSLMAGMLLRVFGPWLISHASDIRSGASIVPRLGAL